LHKLVAAGRVAMAAAALVAKEAHDGEHFVWMTTWQIQPGTLADFERAWRPGTHPEGMLRAYAYWSEDGRENVGISFWVSRASCGAWRASAAEARRREAMAAYVVGEQEAFYRGRELVVPAR
jgi:heme-degrading monooxygenase HmoA